MIYFAADLHLNHNKPFVWEARGFSSVEEMNETIIERFNSIIQPEDDLYLLGDCIMGDNTIGIELLKRLNGNLYIIIGNHDTATRIEEYQKLPNIMYVGYGWRMKYKKISFEFSHRPMYMGNYDEPKPEWNISGHVHATTKFYEDMQRVYNVSVDAHDCYPVSIDQVVEDIKTYIKENMNNDNNN